MCGESQFPVSIRNQVKMEGETRRQNPKQSVHTLSDDGLLNFF
jgi:hypothetical protein